MGKNGISNADVEAALRAQLSAEGYALSALRQQGETGVDIVARRGTEVIHIECIGYKSSGPARAFDFYQSFFRIVSRLNDGAKRLVIAQAAQAEVGLPARAKQHRVAWERIGDGFPELELWLVSVDGLPRKETHWNDWLGR